jgi:hypothetical protein
VCVCARIKEKEVREKVSSTLISQYSWVETTAVSNKRSREKETCLCTFLWCRIFSTGKRKGRFMNQRAPAEKKREIENYYF